MAEKQEGGFLRNSIFSKLDELKMPPVYMEMKGNAELTIEGCRGNLEYDSLMIRVSVEKAAVAVHGRGLSIKCLSLSSVVICGVITSIEYEG